MLTATFTLTWPDGRRVTARIEAVSAEAEYPVQYEGATERIVDPPTRSDVPFLGFVMRQTAERTGGQFDQEFVGQYDRQAGGREGL
jgi:hypothetical protein